MPFPERLKKIRKDLKKTQKEMGDSLGVSFRSIQRYEEGKSVPDVLFLVELALLGINIHWLITGDGYENSYNNPSTDPMLKQIWEWLENSSENNLKFNEWFREEFEKRFPEFIDFKRNK